MNLSLKRRGPLAAASVVCLTLLSGGAWAEGADAAADPNQNRRTNPQTRPLGRDGNPAPPPVTSQQRNREPGANANPQTPPIPQQRRTETNRETQPQGEERRRRENNWRENSGRDNTGLGNFGQGSTGQGNAGQGNIGREFNRRDNDRRDWRDNDRHDWRDNDRRDGRWAEHGWRGPSSPPAYHRHVYIGPHRHEVRPDRRRVYRNVVVLRPYGGWYSGYGRYYHDRDAYRWLGLTAITFGVLGMLNEYQQRALEDAQIAATTAPIGAPIVWGDPYARGTVVATRDGWSDSGHYCREFQQTVEIGGRMEQAYGTACQQPDGSWQVIS